MPAQKLFVVLFGLIISSCNNSAPKVQQALGGDSIVNGNQAAIAKTVNDRIVEANNQRLDSSTQTCFVVITDTGFNYNSLREKMESYNHLLNIEIDTMGRTYNPEKNLIALPDSDEDEIYAGDYLPRRYPGEFLSLEYLNFYNDNAPQKLIALVAGIYERKESADSAVRFLHPYNAGTFILKSDIYMDCVH